MTEVQNIVEGEEEDIYTPINKEDVFAKNRLKDFILMDIEENLTFSCKEGEGNKIVQRMRVRLSKLRSMALRRNRVVDEFKMFLISIEHTIGGQETVILRKSKSKITDVSDELNKITNEFPIVAGTKLGQIPQKIMPVVKEIKIQGEE